MQSYSSPYTGAFNPNTGDKTWDQNLSTIGSVLFPDQSKIAQAYHYGSEARKAQIESNRALDQMAAGHAGLGMQFGLRPNPTYQSTPFGTIMNDPYENYGATQGPTAPPATQGPTAPPAPPGAPVAPAQAPSTLAAAITQLPPEALSLGIVAGVENNTSSGTLPPMAPATAVSGPEPTTTTSNGMSPQNAPRNLQPGSVTSAGGGGRIYAPPGASDGTPSPVNFNFGQYVGLLVQSGMPFQAAQAAATATLGNMAKNGQMAVPLAENLAAFMGAPSMRNQVIANEGSANVANIQAAASIKGHQIQEAGAMARTLAPTTFIPDPDPAKAAQGVGRFVPLGQQQGLGGYQGTNPAAVAESVKQGQFFVPGPGGGKVQTMPAGVAVAQGLPAAGADQAAQMIQRYHAATDPAEKAQILAGIQALAATPKELDPEKQLAQNKFDYRTTQQIYTVPQKALIRKPTITEPSAFDFDASTEIDRRAYELGQQPGNAYLKTDPAKAREAAIHDLMRNPTKEGLRLPTPAEVAQQRQATVPARYSTLGLKGDPRLGDFTNPNVKGAEPTPHMMIRLVPKDYKPPSEETPAKGGKTTTPPAGGTPAPTSTTTPFTDPSIPATAAPAPTATVPAAAAVPAPAPTAAAPPAAPYTPPGPGLLERLSSIYRGNTPAYQSPRPGQAAAPQATQAVPAGPAPTVAGGAPPGSLGPAPAGSVEGQTGRHRGTGQPAVNHGGWMFPAQ